MSEEGPDLGGVPDEEIVEALADMFHAQELREWMSANGMERSRGARKLDSARQAVEQERDAIARMLYDEGKLEADWKRRCEYHAVCGNETASPRVKVCDECTDVSRTAEYEGGPDREDFDSMNAYMAELHAMYDDD